MTIPIIEKLPSRDNPFAQEYYAFYSSWFGGIVTDPNMMMLPIDDHMVHRGDGVFEVMKSVSGAIYLLDEHLHRLFKSAESIGLQSPYDTDKIKEIIFATLHVSKQDTALIRVFLSRGPGDFTVNPYDSVGAQLYVVITKLKPPAPEKYTKGVVIGKSLYPAKPPWMAKIKSCNYLLNVLMKKEAVDRHLDYVIGTDEAGNLTESATENLLILDQDGKIIHPEFDGILKGTTMLRACELATENGMLTIVRSISLTDLLAASEVLITGTSLDVLPVVKFEDAPIGSGQPGPIAQKLNALMQHDIANYKNIK
ncbi:MAG: aminotransferase class IV [Pseudomonadota bacterium]|nr:aminotransferase class IV [Pseudomonadota bacterium]